MKAMKAPKLHTYYEKSTGIVFLMDDYTGERVAQMIPPYTLEDADNLTQSWNACINLEHPESDIKQIVEALKGANAHLKLLLPDLENIIETKMVVTQINNNDEALALYKE